MGCASVEHGIFEVLQGNTPTNGIMIDAIGDNYRFRPGAGEAALALIPNFIVTCILATIFVLLVIIWSIRYVDKEYGVTILLILTLTVFLVGGGFAPIFVSLLAVDAATRIDKPLTWWKNHLPGRKWIVKLWPRALIAFLIIFSVTLIMQIFGLPFGFELTMTAIGILCIPMIAHMPITVMVAFVYDTQS